MEMASIIELWLIYFSLFAPSLHTEISSQPIHAVQASFLSQNLTQIHHSHKGS